MLFIFSSLHFVLALNAYCIYYAAMRYARPPHCVSRTTTLYSLPLSYLDLHPALHRCAWSCLPIYPRYRHRIPMDHIGRCIHVGVLLLYTHFHLTNNNINLVEQHQPTQQTPLVSDIKHLLTNKTLTKHYRDHSTKRHHREAHHVCFCVRYGVFSSRWCFSFRSIVTTESIRLVL